MELIKIYDGRNFGQFDDGQPLVIKADFKDEKGINYFGWKLSEGELHHDMNYNFTQMTLPSGKKCQRKVSTKIVKQLLGLIEENKSSFRQWK